MTISDEQLAADAEDAKPGHNSLAELTDLVKDHQDLSKELADLEDQVKSVKAQIRDYEMVKIPDAMVSINVETVRTLDGAEVSVKPIVEGSIPKKNQQEACIWLRQHGHEDIIRRDVKLTFTRGQDEQAVGLCEELASRGYAPVSEESVHASTLKSWALEQINSGNPDLTEAVMKLLGIFHARRARIKIPKN